VIYTSESATEPLLGPVPDGHHAFARDCRPCRGDNGGWPVYQYVQARMDDLDHDIDLVLSSMPSISADHLTYSLVHPHRPTNPPPHRRNLALGNRPGHRLQPPRRTTATSPLTPPPRPTNTARRTPTTASGLHHVHPPDQTWKRSTRCPAAMIDCWRKTEARGLRKAWLCRGDLFVPHADATLRGGRAILPMCGGCRWVWLGCCVGLPRPSGLRSGQV
jgi:hypothetical protein